MIHGGICRYQGGSQLAAAVAFLRAHRGRVALITIDIGANDVEQCSGSPDLARLATCTQGPPAYHRQPDHGRHEVKAAAKGVTILAMNYYLPALAEWRNGLTGRAVAWLAEKLAVSYNNMLDKVYQAAGIKVANVFAAFDTTNFGDGGRRPPAQRHPGVPLDLGVRRLAPRPEPAREPSRRTRSSRGHSGKFWGRTGWVRALPPAYADPRSRYRGEGAPP